MSYELRRDFYKDCAVGNDWRLEQVASVMVWIVSLFKDML